MRRETQNVVLLLLGGGLASLALTGGYLRYVKPALFVPLLAAGVVTVGLAVVAIVVDVRRGGADDGPDDGHGHGHRHHTYGGWLLLVPVLAIYLVGPPALGADSVHRTAARTLATTQRTAHFPPLPAGNDPVGLRVSDFVTRAGWDANDTLRGRTVALTGFVDNEGGATRLVRMTITCCAADAVPMMVRLTGIPATADDTWLRVTGQLAPGGTRYLPTLSVATAAPVPVPREPYED